MPCGYGYVYSGTTDALKYGKRVLAVGLKCFEMWRTKEGLDLVGPRYFGCDTDYIPLEEMQRRLEIMYKLGIDVGGTNTDAVLIDENLNIIADIKHPTSEGYLWRNNRRAS